MAQSNADYDLIFAGGGAASCVIVGRLMTADPSLRILIVEVGPHVQEDLSITQPARFLSHLVPETKTLKFVVPKPSEHLGGRVAVVTAGQCVGGAASINFTMYNRAVRSEFDDWETKFKNPGWGSDEMFPLAHKAETYDVDPHTTTHGTSGPLHVSFGGRFPQMAQEFLELAAQYDKDRKVVEDGSDPAFVGSYGRWPKWINGTTGRRSDVAHHYLYPHRNNSNLQIVSGHYVKHVIFENGRAVGVEYVPRSQQADTPSEAAKAYAKKLVVLSAGSLGSPLILERSGIGAASVLEKVGVKQIVNLPGVGERYQDHQIVVGVCRADESADTMDGIFRGDPQEVEKWNTQWLKDGTGLMSTNGLDAGIKYRPTETEVKLIGPAFEQRWKSYYADHSDRTMMWFGCANFCFGAVEFAPPGKYFAVGHYINHPLSMGYVHITSGEDPEAPPDFTHGYLEHDADMEVHVYAYKRAREFARRMKSYRGEFAGRQPAFAPDSPAAIREDPKPVPLDAPEIQYTEQDNEAIKQFIREVVQTSWHALGTCAMMPREEGGVVDSRLNVYGVEGLKIADLSIAPLNVGANTYSTTCAIAEKAALIIAEELGIAGV